MSEVVRIRVMPLVRPRRSVDQVASRPSSSRAASGASSKTNGCAARQAEGVGVARHAGGDPRLDVVVAASPCVGDSSGRASCRACACARRSGGSRPTGASKSGTAVVGAALARSSARVPSRAMRQTSGQRKNAAEHAVLVHQVVADLAALQALEILRLAVEVDAGLAGREQLVAGLGEEVVAPGWPTVPPSRWIASHIAATHSDAFTPKRLGEVDGVVEPGVVPEDAEQVRAKVRQRR